MAGERIILAQLDLDTQSLIKASMEAKASLLALKKEQNDLKKAGEEGSAIFFQIIIVLIYLLVDGI